MQPDKIRHLADTGLKSVREALFEGSNRDGFPITNEEAWRVIDQRITSVLVSLLTEAHLLGREEGILQQMNGKQT